MRVENYNTLSYSSKSSSAEKIGNVKLPDYNDFLTKTEPAMTDNKFREAIIEQAKKDQAAGKFQSESAGFRSLVKSYVSAVSPDRKNIISQGLTAIFKNNKPETKTLNLIELLLGKVKYQKEDNNLTYAEFYDSNGELVASFSNGTWTAYGTKAENARESEAWAIYNQAWNSAAKESQINTSARNFESTEMSLDVSV